MPGRLAMDEQSAMGSQDLKKDRSYAQEEIPHPQSNASAIHSPNGVMVNGIPAAELPPPTMNGESSMANATLAGLESPPALDQSWREHDSYKSLGLLMERLAQSCYKELNVTLTEMSQIPMQPQQHQQNGIVPHAGEDTDDGSRKKKRLLMDFAKEQRDRFIKTLVLSDWCKNAEDQGKLIDVKVWQDKQGTAQSNATAAIARTKANIEPAKMPHPNIEGAMELLATSKASWIPDLGYVSPQRLTAKQLLKTLRNMNVILATRLNLHEDLPPHFQEFSVADGRATFIMKDECEVDLSVADEDPATPFYFIDIRLLFTPASNILDDRLRGFMEAKVNQELATKGLKGCYDFLHNFVITHKINVLRSQAMEMIRGKWFDCVRPESLRRNFVLQYWCGMPAPKSWIEVGISSGKAKSAASKRSTTPHISVRWYRRAVEATNEPLEFDWRQLSLERCLSTVISKHTEWILNDLETRLRGLAGSNSAITIAITGLEATSDIPVLSLYQKSLPEAVRLRLEPVTGQFSITPAMASTAHAERRLNNDPSADAAKWLAWVLCVALQERVRRESDLLGWTPTPNLAKQDNLQRLFGEAVRHISVYSPNRAWGDRWALAVTFSLGGEKWWAVSLEQRRDEQGNVSDEIITSAHCVRHLDEYTVENPLSRRSLIRIEKLAVSEVAFSALSKQLKEMRIPHRFEKLAKGMTDDEIVDKSRAAPMAMFVRFSALMKPPLQKAWKSWADELLRLTHYGVVKNTDASGDDPRSIRHDLRLTLEPGNLRSLQKYLGHPKDRDLAMSSSGALAMRFLTPFGQPFALQIQKRLQSVERLDRYLTILQKSHFKCTHVSLSRLAFTYNTSPELNAQLDFSKDGGLPVRLKLYPPTTNPHQRTRVLLEQNLSNMADKGFASFTQVLAFTLPVLRSFEQLENAHPAKHSLDVHPRTATCFSLKYRPPLPGCEFQLKAKKKIQGEGTVLKWHIEEGRDPKGKAASSEDFVKALKELWQDKGAHWEGVGNGIIADGQGIGDALKRLDELVWRFEKSEEALSKSKEDPQQLSNQAAAQTHGQPPVSSTNTKSAPIKAEPDVIMLD